MFGVYYSAVFLYVEILIHRFSQIYTDFVDYTDLHRFSQISPLVFTFSKWTALQAAATAAQALLDGQDAPQPADLSATLANIRSAKGSAAVSRPEFQWGAVIRSNNTGSATPTTVTQAMSVSPDGSSVFTLNQFTTTASGTDGAAAIYRRYDADSLLASQTAYGAVESSTTYSSKQNLLVYKLNRQGDILWQLNSDCGQVDAAYSQITPTADGGLLLAIKACFSGEYGANSDSTLLRLVENDGVTKHALKWVNPITFNARHVILARIDADGHVRWIKPGITVDDRQLPGTSGTTGRAVDAIYVNGLEEDKDGNFYLAGRYVRDITLTKPDGSKITLSPRNTEGWNGDSQESRGDALLVKLDRNGDFLWNLETGGTLYYQSVGAITLANNRLFIFGNAQAPAGQAGTSYFAIQRDTIYPSDKTGAYVARLDVSSGTPALQWLTALNARQQTNARGGYVWTHNVDYDGGELLLTGRFTGFIDNADGSNILANDYPSGTTTTQKGYIMRLNASTGKVLAASMQGITGYYRAAFRESRIYAFGYTLGSTFYHVYSPNLAAPTGTTLFSGGMATGWDAAFFDDQLITVHRTRQAAPYINGLAEGYGLRAENAFAFSAYYTSHRMEGLQRQPVSHREALEDSLRAVKAAYPDPTPYTATSWAALEAALAAAADTLAAAAPVAEAASNAAMAAVRAAASGLITLDVGTLMALLQDSIAAAKVSYPQDLYTETTWNALQLAIAGGETLLAAPAQATESQLIAAIGDLSKAVSNLMTVALHDARTALIALLDSAQGYDADSYIPATYASLQAAIVAAQGGIAAGNTATVAALHGLGASLAGAIDGLVTKVSAARIALQDTISAAQAAYAQATYTEASFAALQASLAAAQDLLSDGQEHTVEQYEAAGAEIAAAISGLTTKVAAARLALQDSIEHTRATYAQAGYTAATWAALQDSVSDAQALLNSGAATAAELEAAAVAVSRAVSALVTNVFVAAAALQDTLAAAQSLTELDYTAATWAALQDSVSAAQALLAGGAASVAELEAAAAAVSRAVSALVTKVSEARVALQTALDSAKTNLVQASYTAESWAPLQVAIGSAEAALADSASSLLRLATAASTLQAAVADLVAATPTGVYRVANGSGVTVATRPSTIVVRGAPAGATIMVVSAGGSVIHRSAASGDVQEFAVSTGFYIVAVSGKAVKVAVR